MCKVETFVFQIPAFGNTRTVRRQLFKTAHKLRISNIKVNKIIRRPSKFIDENGNRIFEEYEYDFQYTPYFKNRETQRLLAKIIDLIPFILLFNIKFNFLQSLFYSIPLVINYGTMSESIFGKTFGKRIFSLVVIDDFANNPKFLKSLKRNVLCLINFFPTFTDKQDRAGVWYTAMNFNMQLNNKLCKTYIVKEKMVEEIKELLKKQAVA